MTKAIIARQAGDEYQDDWFWLQATRALRAGAPVTRVGYEIENALGFDDVACFYGSPVCDEFGDQVTADYYQVKFHVDYSGALTARALTEPLFIGSSQTSLLQRVQRVQVALAPQGKGIRLFVVTPWLIHPDDPLAELVSTQNGEMRFGSLFKGGLRSAMGIVRRLWTTHLGLENEDALRRVLRPLRILHSPSQSSLREQLNYALTAVGLASAGDSLPGNPYHGVIRRLHREGKTEFSRAELTEACKACGLFTGGVRDSGAIRLGIRSFLRWAEHLEDETDYILDLLPFFDNRAIHGQKLWEKEVLPNVTRFLEKHVRADTEYRLYLDTHSSIAFAVGYVLDTKCGAHIIPMQRTTNGRVAWDVQSGSPNERNEGWEFSNVVVSEGDEVAVAVSVTHDALQDVELFVAAYLPRVGRIIHACIAGGPSSSAMKDGSHAFSLAQQLVSRAKRECLTRSGSSPLHLFLAAPNGFVFFVGRHSRVLGDCVLYEYEFESNRPGGYQRSLQLPLRHNLEKQTSE